MTTHPRFHNLACDVDAADDDAALAQGLAVSGADNMYCVHGRLAWMGMVAQGKERLREGLGFGACRTKAEAGAHPQRVDCQEQMEAFIPAQPVAPANSSEAGQPAHATVLGIPRGDARAVEGFVRTPLGRQQRDEVQTTRHQRLIRLAHVAIELLPGG